MAAIHTESAAIFGHKNVNVAEQKVVYVDTKPTNPISANSVMEFTIPGNTNQYVSLKETYLHAIVEIRLTKNGIPYYPQKPLVPDGYNGHYNNLPELPIRYNSYKRRRPRPDMTTLTEDQRQSVYRAYETEALVWKNLADGLSDDPNYQHSAYPIDAIFHTMWNNMDVWANGQLVSTTNGMFPYKSYIETVLNNSGATKEYQLGAVGFTGNENGTVDRDDPGVESNPFLVAECVKKRKKMLPINMRHDLFGYPACDLWGINASIVHGVELTIKLYPNKDAFRLMTFPKGVEAELVLHDITLKVCKKTMDPRIVIAHNHAMEKTKDATYPFIRSEIRAFNVPKGSLSATIENPYQSNLPVRFIFGMVRADAKNGLFSANPLNFQHFNIATAGFYINGEPTPKRPYVLNPNNNQYLEPMIELYSILGKMGEDTDIGLTRDEFLRGTFLIPFDVQPTASGKLDYLAKRTGGHCKLEITFHEELAANISIITYAIFPAMLDIDFARNVKVIELERPFRVFGDTGGATQSADV